MFLKDEKTNDTTEKQLEKIDDVISLFEMLSNNASAKIKIRICSSRSYLMSDQTMQSSIYTLKSIAFCLKKSHISDAGVLTRKFRDDLIQFLFILETMELTQSLNACELDNYFDKGYEGIICGIEELYRIHESGIKKTKRDIAIDSWFDNSLKNKDSIQYRREFFDTSKYIHYLKKEKQIKKLFDNYIGECWYLSDRKLNNYVHSNGREYIFRNIPQYTKQGFENYVEEITNLIIDIAAMFLCIYILIDPSCIQSSDFIDYTDAEMQPPENCQYWVAGIATYFIDKYVTQIHTGLKLYLKNENKYGMQIE